MTVRIRVRGVPETRRNLRRLDRAVRRDVERAGRVAAAKVLAAEARRRAPVATGRLRRSVRVDEAGRNIDVVADTDYAIYVERGTRYARAQPFLEPALRASGTRMLMAASRAMARRFDAAVRGLRR